MTSFRTFKNVQIVALDAHRTVSARVASRHTHRVDRTRFSLSVSPASRARSIAVPRASAKAGGRPVRSVSRAQHAAPIPNLNPTSRFSQDTSRLFSISPKCSRYIEKFRRRRARTSPSSFVRLSVNDVDRVSSHAALRDRSEGTARLCLSVAAAHYRARSSARYHCRVLSPPAYLRARCARAINPSRRRTRRASTLLHVTNDECDGERESERGEEEGKREKETEM